MKILFAIAFLCSWLVVCGQDTINNKQEDVTITAFRFAEKLSKVPFTIKRIKNEGWNMNTPTTADVLQNSGSVLVQKSQAGGGSPIIRGFEASRILLMVDGVRLNNAIYRSGHLQNIITVDANALSAVDILYGPSSTQYGSDALGGVVHMQTLKPTLSKTQKSLVKVNMANRYSSAISEWQSHVDMSIGNNKWGAISSFTYSQFGDVVQGDRRRSKYPDFGKRYFYTNTISGKDYIVPNANYNKQKATGYHQYDLLQKIMYEPNSNEQHILNVQYSNTNDIPRYDRLTELTNTGEPRFAEWYYGPQKRGMLSYGYQRKFVQQAIKLINTTIAFQDLEESRYDRRFDNSSRNSSIENIKVWSASMDALIKNNKQLEGHTGIDVQWNNVQSKAYQYNIITGERKYNITTRYPDGKNIMTVAAIYYQWLYKAGINTNINAGVRYTVAQLKSSFTNNTVAQFPFSDAQQKNKALVGNLGITHNTANNVRLAAVVSTGFRAPNFDELKVFDSRAGFLIVPNPNLKPEYSYNAELNVSRWKGVLQYSAALFFTRLHNSVQVANYQYNGTTTTTYLGQLSVIQAAQNIGRANLYGASASASYTIRDKINVEGAYNYTKGKLITPTKEPLDHIPPAYGRFGVKYKRTIWNMELYTLFNGWKKLNNYSKSGEDNLQYATADGMPSWYTVNIRTQVALQPKMYLMLGLENILDKNYRVFASGISAPGRNFVLSLKASL
jgi:hemoglobin/transferrin/lactoferrin receptor protein